MSNMNAVRRKQHFVYQIRWTNGLYMRWYRNGIIQLYVGGLWTLAMRSAICHMLYVSSLSKTILYSTQNKYTQRNEWNCSSIQHFVFPTQKC